MAGYGLIEAVKEKTDFKSDYAVAKQVGIGRSNISNYKNSDTMPDAVTVLKLAELAQLTPAQALAKLQGGYASASLMAMTAIGSTALLLSHSWVLNTVYYVKLARTRKRVVFPAWLRPLAMY